MSIRPLYESRVCPRCEVPQLRQRIESNDAEWFHDDDGSRRDSDQCVIDTLDEENASLRARVAELEASEERLAAALVKAEHHAHMNRIWMGVDGWKYNACPAFRIKKIAEIARDALRQRAETQGEETK